MPLGQGILRSAVFRFEFDDRTPVMKRWLLALGAVTAMGGSWYAWRAYWRVEVLLRADILHSKSGPLEIHDRSMIDAGLMAIDEINQRGRLLGREVKPMVADGRSDPKVFAREARRPIETEKVGVILGCWTSLCRRSVKSVVEPSNHLLFFPSNLPWQDPRRRPVRQASGTRCTQSGCFQRAKIEILSAIG